MFTQKEFIKMLKLLATQNLSQNAGLILTGLGVLGLTAIELTDLGDSSLMNNDDAYTNFESLIDYTYWTMAAGGTLFGIGSVVPVSTLLSLVYITKFAPDSMRDSSSDRFVIGNSEDLDANNNNTMGDIGSDTCCKTILNTGHYFSETGPIQSLFGINSNNDLLVTADFLLEEEFTADSFDEEFFLEEKGPITNNLYHPLKENDSRGSLSRSSSF